MAVRARHNRYGATPALFSRCCIAERSSSLEWALKGVVSRFGIEETAAAAASAAACAATVEPLLPPPPPAIPPPLAACIAPLRAGARVAAPLGVGARSDTLHANDSDVSTRRASGLSSVRRARIASLRSAYVIAPEEDLSACVVHARKGVGGGVEVSVGAATCTA